MEEVTWCVKSNSEKYYFGTIHSDKVLGCPNHSGGYLGGGVCKNVLERTMWVRGPVVEAWFIGAAESQPVKLRQGEKPGDKAAEVS